MKKLLFLIFPLLIIGCTKQKSEQKMGLVSIKLALSNSPDIFIAKDKNLIKEFENEVNNSSKSSEVLKFGYKYIANLNFTDSSETIYMTNKTMFIGSNYYKLNDTIYKTDGNLGAICEKIVNSK